MNDEAIAREALIKYQQKIYGRSAVQQGATTYKVAIANYFRQKRNDYCAEAFELALACKAPISSCEAALFDLENEGLLKRVERKASKSIQDRQVVYSWVGK